MTGTSVMRARRVLLGASVGLAIAAIAGCSSGGRPASATSAAPAASTGSAVAASTGAVPGAVTVQAHDGPLGTYLTDGSGRTLYMFASDSASRSSCTGACAAAWPPLTVSGAAVAGTGVRSDQFGTVPRTDGAAQLSYAGHPLYYFEPDSAPGQVTGQGSNGFGAKWWLLAPSGQPITAAAPAPSTSADSGGGGGGGYGY